MIGIQYDRACNAFWHTNCVNHLGGVMQEVKREHDKSLFNCLHCGKHGYYPVGSVGEIQTDEVHPDHIQHAAETRGNG